MGWHQTWMRTRFACMELSVCRGCANVFICVDVSICVCVCVVLKHANYKAVRNGPVITRRICSLTNFRTYHIEEMPLKFKALRRNVYHLQLYTALKKPSNESKSICSFYFHIENI